PGPHAARGAALRGGPAAGGREADGGGGQPLGSSLMAPPAQVLSARGDDQREGGGPRPRWRGVHVDRVRGSGDDRLTRLATAGGGGRAPVVAPGSDGRRGHVPEAGPAERATRGAWADPRADQGGAAAPARGFAR